MNTREALGNVRQAGGTHLSSKLRLITADTDEERVFLPSYVIGIFWDAPADGKCYIAVGFCLGQTQNPFMHTLLTPASGLLLSRLFGHRSKESLCMQWTLQEPVLGSIVMALLLLKRLSTDTEKCEASARDGPEYCLIDTTK